MSDAPSTRTVRKHHIPHRRDENQVAMMGAFPF